MWGGASLLGFLYVSMMKNALYLLEQQEQRQAKIEDGVNNKRSTSPRAIMSTISIQDSSTSLTDNNSNKDGMGYGSDQHDFDDYRFIIFQRVLSGQGAGNMMNGLLAAHLLGREFNRTVCVEQGYEQFHTAFESIHPHVLRHCPTLVENVHLKNHLQVLTFLGGDKVDECHLQERLASSAKVVTFLGNSYPRWPRVQEKKFFFQHYRARPELLDILAPDSYDYNGGRSKHSALACARSGWQ
jgi:hypothetical protein